MAEEKPKLEVEILDERVVTTYPKIGEAAKTHLVTYRYGDMAPRTIFIPEAEDTPENRAKLIREDIEKTAAYKPTTMKV